MSFFFAGTFLVVLLPLATWDSDEKGAETPTLGSPPAPTP